MMKCTEIALWLCGIVCTIAVYVIDARWGVGVGGGRRCGVALAVGGRRCALRRGRSCLRRGRSCLRCRAMLSACLPVCLHQGQAGAAMRGVVRFPPNKMFFPPYVFSW